MWERIPAGLATVRDSLIPIFELFRDERVAIALAIALIATAILSALWFWLRDMWPWLRALKRAERRIKEAADPRTFRNSFTNTDEFLRSDKRLGHIWTEFRESLIFPYDEMSPRQIIRNTARPQNYFNIQSAVDAGLPLPSFLALPNVFVGLGLLFTFVGLVAALHFAAQGVTSPDLPEAQSSLQALLKAATFKFMTSIVGVGISIVLSAVFRTFVGWLRHGLDRFCNALEARLQFISTESLAAEQLKELEKQSLQLERFNTDFAVELAGVLDQRLNATLSASLSHAVQPVVTAVQNLAGNMGSMNQGAIETMIRDFQTGLKQSSGEEMTSLVAALGQVRETLDHAAAGLKANGADFGSRLDQVAEHMERRLGDAARSMSDGLAKTATQLERVLGELSERLRKDAEGASIDLSKAVSAAGKETQAALSEAGAAFSAEVRETANEFARALAPTMATLPSFEQTLKTLDGRFAQQVRAFDETIERLRLLSAQLDQGSQRLREAAAPISSTANQFAAASQRIEAASAALQDTRARFADLNEQLKLTFDANRKVWDEYRSRFEQVDQHLEKVVKTLIDGNKQQQQNVRDFVKELDAQLAKAVNSFAGAVTELNEFTDELGQHLSRLGDGKQRHSIHSSKGGS
jgi:ABC-type transporter Mla subunit MlaD